MTTPSLPFHCSPVGLHKAKSAWYCCTHRMKSELASIEKVINVFFIFDKPDYTSFFNKLHTQFDYELACQVRGSISKICDAWKEVEKIINGITQFVSNLKGLPRKDAALKIISSYGKETGRTSMCFTLLDNKTLSDDQLKKLVYQVLK